MYPYSSNKLVEDFKQTPAQVIVNKDTTTLISNLSKSITHIKQNILH